MKLSAGLFLLGATMLIGCKAAEPVHMDAGRLVPSATGKCQDWVAGRMVQVDCPPGTAPSSQK